MVSFRVTIDEGGHYADYEPPQLTGIEIDEETVQLEFDPSHSDKTSMTYDRSKMISLEATV